MKTSKHGSGRKQVLFLHGMLCEADSWDKVVALAPEGATSWVVDLPDHAEDAPGTTVRNIESAVVRLVEDERLRDLTLVGHSFGAYVTARLAPRLPEVVSRVVLISGVPWLPEDLLQAYDATVRALEEGEQPVLEVLAPMLDTAFGRFTTPELAVRLRSVLERWPRARVIRELRRAQELGRAVGAVTSFSQPGVVLHGESDVLVSTSLARELTALGPRLSLSLVADGPHFLPLTHPEIVARAAYETG